MLNTLYVRTLHPLIDAPPSLPTYPPINLPTLVSVTGITSVESSRRAVCMSDTLKSHATMSWARVERCVPAGARPVAVGAFLKQDTKSVNTRPVDAADAGDDDATVWGLLTSASRALRMRCVYCRGTCDNAARVISLPLPLSATPADDDDDDDSRKGRSSCRNTTTTMRNMPSSLSHNSSTRVEGSLLLLLLPWAKTVESVFEKYEPRPRIDLEGEEGEEGLPPVVCSGSVERLCVDPCPSPCCCCTADSALSARELLKGVLL